MPGADERQARLALSLLAEPGDPLVCGDVRLRGPVEVLQSWGREQVIPPYQRKDRPGDPTAALQRAERLLGSASAAGHRWVCPGEPEWPAGLDDLDEIGCLQRRGGAPLGVWLRGPAQLSAATARSVAVVGSRASTTYGSQVTGDLSAESAGRGIAVVSGAAYGIDSAAHRGAIASKGTTIAVLACGVDVAYPRGHESLLARIGDEGLIVSELPAGATPTRLRFLSRNRLIAALTTGTVVVEAALRSGALNTANWAGELGRVVMGVPGPVTSVTSQGVHRLIRDGGAQLVTSGADIAESIAPLGTDTGPWREGERRLVDDLPDDDLAVLEALRLDVAASTGDLAAQARVDIGRAHAALGRLLGARLAEPIGGGWRLSPGAVASLRAR
jgi:DNA processing protein